jgi:regulator of nucleoside diphosphate kinase
MFTMTTKAANEIILTEHDFDRLKTLAESPRYRMTHAMLLMALRQELDRGKVVAPTKVPRGVITMNTHVRIRDLKTDEIEEYTLVYPDEADINDGRLSILAPLGTALLGARIGQVVRFDAPAGERKLKIERILYQPEAAGDYHL